MTTPVFELRNINYYFDNKHVLENINIKINKGEFQPSLVLMERENPPY